MNTLRTLDILTRVYLTICCCHKLHEADSLLAAMYMQREEGKILSFLSYTVPLFMGDQVSPSFVCDV
jgi:hypothetical protein